MIIPAFYMHAGQTGIFEKTLENSMTLKISCKIDKIQNQWQAFVDLTISTLSLAPITRQRVFKIDGHKFLGIYHSCYENKGITENFADPKGLVTSPFSPEAIGAGYSDTCLIALSPYPNVVILSPQFRGFSSNITPTPSVSQAGSAAAKTINSDEHIKTPSPTSSSRLLDPKKQKNPPIAITGYKGTDSATGLNSNPSSSICIIC
jgi:hypothetical protein